MVFTTVVNYVRARGPDEFWRKRRIFRLAANYVGRRRNCYSVAIKIVHRALVYATKGRKLKGTIEATRYFDVIQQVYKSFSSTVKKILEFSIPI